MRIALIGGHGKVALLAEPLLVAAGHEVTAVIRNPDHAAQVGATGATPLVADVETMDDAAWVELLTGHDAVVWSAGAGGGSAARTYAVDRDAAIRSVDAAGRSGVDRYVMVSYFGAGPDHGVPEGDSFFAYAEAKAAADTHLRGSALAWTILGPSGLTLDDPTGRIAVVPDARRADTVARADVARVIVETLARPALGGRTVEFTNGPTPIPEALDALTS